MFPLNSNMQYIKDNGERDKLGNVIGSGGSEPYVLPTATATVLGGIKVGEGLSIADGVLSASGGSGSSDMHVYMITGSNRPELAPLLIITKYDGVINNGTTLRTAIANDNGVAIGVGAKYNNSSLLDRVTASSDTSTTFSLSFSPFTISDNAITISSGSSNLNVSNVTNLVSVKII